MVDQSVVLFIIMCAFFFLYVMFFFPTYMLMAVINPKMDHMPKIDGHMYDMLQKILIVHKKYLLNVKKWKKKVIIYNK